MSKIRLIPPWRRGNGKPVRLFYDSYSEPIRNSRGFYDTMHVKGLFTQPKRRHSRNPKKYHAIMKQRVGKKSRWIWY